MIGGNAYFKGAEFVFGRILNVHIEMNISSLSSSVVPTTFNSDSSLFCPNTVDVVDHLMENPLKHQ